MQLGRMVIRGLVDGRITYPAGAIPTAEARIASVQGRPDAAEHGDYISDRSLSLDAGGYLVETADRLVLIDAGMGPGLNPLAPSVDVAPGATALTALADFYSSASMTDGEVARLVESAAGQRASFGLLPQNLARLGIRPGDVTDVILTHLHPTHYGWISDRTGSFFANARIWAHAADLEHVAQESGSAEQRVLELLYQLTPSAEVLRLLKSQLRPWNGHTTTITPGVTLRWMPGHTPGSCVVDLTSDGARAVIVGDVIRCPLEVVDHSFVILANADQGLARRSRARLLTQIRVDPGLYIGGTHFSGLRLGRVEGPSTSRRWRWHDEG